MKATKFATLLVLALAFTIIGTGCKKKPVGVTDIPGSKFRVGDNTPKGPGNALPFNPGDDPNANLNSKPLPELNLENFNQNRSELAAHIIHFDFDSALVKSGDQGNISAVAAYLGSNTGVALLVEGHCDERGTEEYNRSLGSLRASNAREALIAAGADANRITTATFGEDKPVATGQDESSYTQNRRGEFIVLTPK